MTDQIDPETFVAIQKENWRQEGHIELIASENYISPVVMATQGSQLTNKYAGGYPGKYYYGGYEYMDVVEQLIIDRIKQLFGTEVANMQPNSGPQANQGVFFVVLKPDGTIMGMSLAEDDHLTHGIALNMSDKWFNVVSCGLSTQGDTDYDTLETLTQEKKPKLIIAGVSVFALRTDFGRIGKIAKSTGVYFMVDIAHYAGLIVAGVYPNPASHTDSVTTTTRKNLRNPHGGVIPMKAEREKTINSAIFPGIQDGPLIHVVAGRAVAFKEALLPKFKAYQQQVVENVAAMAETLIARGLRIVSDRTENHVIPVDLCAKRITGKETERVLGDTHVAANKNAIPDDSEKSLVTSDVRLGSPTTTIHGSRRAEIVKVAHLIADVLDNPHDGANIAAMHTKVAELTKQFPIYG